MPLACHISRQSWDLLDDFSKYLVFFHQETPTRPLGQDYGTKVTEVPCPNGTSSRMTHCHCDSIGQVKPIVLILSKKPKREGVLISIWGFESVDAS